jgi:hypothetical protein
MQGSKNFFQKSIYLFLVLIFAFGNIVTAQDSDNRFETLNFTFKGSKIPRKTMLAKKPG